MFLKENPKLMQQLDAQVRQRAAQQALQEKEKGKAADAADASEQTPAVR